MHAITLESCRFSLFLFYTMEIRYSYNIHCFHEIVHFSQLYDVTATSKTVSISMWIAFPPMIMKIKSIPVHVSFSMWQYIVWEMNSLNIYTSIIIRILDNIQQSCYNIEYILLAREIHVPHPHVLLQNSYRL